MNMLQRYRWFCILFCSFLFPQSILSEEIKLHDYLNPTKSDLRELKNISRKNGVVFCNSVSQSLFKLYYTHRVLKRPRCSENPYVGAPLRTGERSKKPRPFSDRTRKDDIEYQRSCVKFYEDSSHSLKKFKKYCIGRTKGSVFPNWGKRIFSGMLKEKKQREKFLSKEGLK